MKIKNILMGSMVLSSILVAGGDIAPVEPIVEEVPVSEWETSASIYMWGAGMSGETAGGEEIDVSFSDIMDNLDMGFMGIIRTQKEKWGIESDFVYLEIGTDVANPLINKFSLKTWIITPMVTYEVTDSGPFNLHLLAGGRYLYMKPSITTFRGVQRDTSENLWDGIIGVKGTYDIDEKWFIPFHADIGTGDTDVTWQAFAGIGYKYENFDLMLGYRSLNWDFADNAPGAELFNDLTISGPMLGAKYRF